MVMTLKSRFLIFIALMLALGVFAWGPVPQNKSYHDFADQRTVLGMANACNVLSNALFIFIGAWGVVFAVCLLRNNKNKLLLTQYVLFFAGVFLSGIGSSYYHYAPSNQTLLWDRLPMSIAFMALLASVISESIDWKAGAVLFTPFLMLGILSVLYWIWTENAGTGDLRPYIIVQYLPVLLVPLILVMYRPARNYSDAVWLLVTLYVIAKVFELFDRQVYVFLGIVSGHTIKHLLAALGTIAVLKMLYGRRVELAAGS